MSKCCVPCQGIHTSSQEGVSETTTAADIAHVQKDVPGFLSGPSVNFYQPGAAGVGWGWGQKTVNTTVCSIFWVLHFDLFQVCLLKCESIRILFFLLTA